jgi:8-oxo-dGTP diphosphatase
VPYTPIIGTLGYVLDAETDSVLMVHRTARTSDDHLGKFNGLGGKLEDNEDVASGMMRELYEEAEIVVTAMSLRGTVSWPGFGPNLEDWLGFIFLVTGWEGSPPPSNPEGDLHWIPRRRVLNDPSLPTLPMWEGDRSFLPLVFDDDPRPFHGIMPYHQGLPSSWSYCRL